MNDETKGVAAKSGLRKQMLYEATAFLKKTILSGLQRVLIVHALKNIKLANQTPCPPADLLPVHEVSLKK